ncbi:ATP-binding protein [Haloimpatiens sp. FM7330]|uniref:HAMP domain-containing sensor histidine kinase n=1 Tax=Haloimpatiens sp. FM7330 TaxID=3298610 RepID=UPI00362990CA
MKNITFKKQFIISILLVLILSILFTVAGAYVEIKLIQKGIVLKANYYESRVPEVETYINKNKEKVLNKNFKKDLESIIPIQGIEYEVVNSKGELLYGHFNEIIVQAPVKLKKQSEIDKSESPKMIKYISIINNNKIEGMVILKYELKLSARNPKFNWIVKYLDVFTMLAPFIYIIIFTFVFASKLNNRLKIPLNQLMIGAEKIKNKDLEFKIDYKSKDELGMLCNSFEEMRVELKKSLQEQWKMEQERKEMVGAIAHDLKTPITIIKGHVEGLIDSKRLEEGKVYRYLDLINKNADRMTKLIEKMNILTKIEKSDFTLKFKRCNIIEFINDKTDDYNILADNKKISFEYTIKDERISNGLINMDCGALSAILDNLVSNSIRFTPEGGSIYLNLYLTEEKIILSISDTGCGFSKKDIANIFKKFYQGDESRSKEKGHSGLGLYIVRTLVNKFNGSIEAKNNEKGGAIVSVSMFVS